MNGIAENLKWTYFSNTLAWRSRSNDSFKRRITRLPTKKCKNWRFFVFSMFNSLTQFNWAKLVMCVPQHMLLSTPWIVMMRTSPTWSFGNPLVARRIWKGMTNQFEEDFDADSQWRGVQTSSDISSDDSWPSIWVITGVAAAINSLHRRSTVSTCSWLTTTFGLNSMYDTSTPSDHESVLML